MATREATSRVDDYFLIDELLSDDERLIRGTVRRFVDREVLPHIGGWWLRGEFPAHLIPAIAEMGLLGANLPTEYGAAGVSNIAYGLIPQEGGLGGGGRAPPPLLLLCGGGGCVVFPPPLPPFGHGGAAPPLATPAGPRR